MSTILVCSARLISKSTYLAISSRVACLNQDDRLVSCYGLLLRYGPLNYDNKKKVCKERKVEREKSTTNEERSSQYIRKIRYIDSVIVGSYSNFLAMTASCLQN
jgi:hypothetical protein